MQEPLAFPAGQDPVQVEALVRAAVHRDRRPGQVLAICHPQRMHKVPQGILQALTDAGFTVHQVQTKPERRASVLGIAKAFRELAAKPEPLDVVVFTGDGGLDHHALIAAYLAFYPDLVVERPGEIRVEPPTEEELSRLPRGFVDAF